MKISRYLLTICLASTMLELVYNYTSSEMETEVSEDEVRDEEMEKKEITQSSVSTEEKNIIVSIHSAARSQVEASNMMKMRYYDDIAEKAQIHADSCTFEHDEGSNREVTRLGAVPIGQNLCTGFSSWSDCIYAWINEENNFVYGIGSTNGGEIGHYTQIMLWRTMAIGCGVNSCNGTAFHVCNYAYGLFPKAINVLCSNCGGITMTLDKCFCASWRYPFDHRQYINEVKTPWKIGIPCTDCPNNCAADGFCDCGGKVCSNIYKIPSPQCLCVNWWIA